MMNSLRARLVVSATIVLFIFMGLTGLSLDRAFRESARSNEISRLLSYIHDLLRIAEFKQDSTINFSSSSIDHRLMTPNSGLYAIVLNNDNKIVWASPSLLGVKIIFPVFKKPGIHYFTEGRAGTDSSVYIMSMPIVWVDHQGVEHLYHFHVAESQKIYHSEINAYRKHLWFWLLGSVTVLIILQWVILSWGLAPLKRVARDLIHIEAGTREALTDNYPLELRGLTNNLNALLHHERQRQQRYQQALGNLAHSLKTPLSVLHAAAESEKDIDHFRATVFEQVQTLDKITRYQLQRAATSGKSTFSKPHPVKHSSDQIVRALAKVYQEKNIVFESEIHDDAYFYGVEGDLMEILGNLLDNAAKWCHHRVRIVAQCWSNPAGKGLYIAISDDGPGLPVERREQVIQRGVRADEHMPGHGIGLAVVKDIVEAYGGTVVLETSELGGLNVTLLLPR
jgi:two-component system sensor histidine kinase PhoQ